MKVIKIEKGVNDKIIVRFPYDSSYVEKIKSIKGHRWHPEGHKSSKTTEVYTHVSKRDIGRIQSPLDKLVGKESLKTNRKHNFTHGKEFTK